MTFALLDLITPSSIMVYRTEKKIQWLTVYVAVLNVCFLKIDNFEIKANKIIVMILLFTYVFFF